MEQERNDKLARNVLPTPPTRWVTANWTKQAELQKWMSSSSSDWSSTDPPTRPNTDAFFVIIDPSMTTSQWRQNLAVPFRIDWMSTGAPSFPSLPKYGFNSLSVIEQTGNAASLQPSNPSNPSIH